MFFHSAEYSQIFLCEPSAADCRSDSHCRFAELFFASLPPQTTTRHQTIWLHVSCLSIKVSVSYSAAFFVCLVVVRVARALVQVLVGSSTMTTRTLLLVAHGCCVEVQYEKCAGVLDSVAWFAE